MRKELEENGYSRLEALEMDGNEEEQIAGNRIAWEFRVATQRAKGS